MVCKLNLEALLELSLDRLSTLRQGFTDAIKGILRPEAPKTVDGEYYDIYTTDDSIIHPRYWESLIKPGMSIRMDLREQEDVNNILVTDSLGENYELPFQMCRKFQVRCLAPFPFRSREDHDWIDRARGSR